MSRRSRSPRRAAALAAALAVVAAIPGGARAADAPPDPAPASPPAAPGALPPTPVAPKLDVAVPGIVDHGGAVWYRTTPPQAEPGFQPFDFAPRKNSWIALGETLAIDFGMWQFSYWAGNTFSKISGDSIAQNFKKGWIIDTDPYWVNSFGHPYEGSMFYTAARSTGHNFYESFGFAFLGSLVWEQFMEIQSPSINDQITTPIGGSFLGEVLYRMHRLILDSGGENPGFWRQASAFVVSPIAGFNQLAMGNEFRGPMLLPPSWQGEFRFGMVIGGSATDRRTGATASKVGPWASVGGRIIYGVPGTPDLRLRQPFDHFDFNFGFAFSDGAEPTGGLQIRGLIVGDTIGKGDGFGGLWGLFGSYDVTGVPVFKATGVGLGPGVSLMGRWAWFELHGTAVAEFLPWAGGGSMETLYARDYHYGPGAKGTLQFRAHFSDIGTLDVNFREYWVSGAYATGQSEDMSYGKITATVRIYGPHAVSSSLDWSRRHGSYPDTPDISQSARVWSAYYTLLQGW